jgi:hypothetical protein
VENFGNGLSGHREHERFSEIVIDDEGKDWQAMNGMLISLDRYGKSH